MTKIGDMCIEEKEAIFEAFWIKYAQKKGF